jgi:hypothetical protein
MSDDHLIKSDDHLINLQARVIALELLVRALLTDFALKSTKPLAGANKLREEFLSSLQHLQRPVGEYEDAVWASAADHMRQTLDQVIERISYLQECGQIPLDRPSRK